MPAAGVPLPPALRDLLVGVFSLARRPAGATRRKPWAIRNVRDEDKMLMAEVTK
jgi:hypothetical protein